LKVEDAGERKMREGAGDNCWLSVSKGEGDGHEGTEWLLRFGFEREGAVPCCRLLRKEIPAGGKASV
jgi:hypothetical protein